MYHKLFTYYPIKDIVNASFQQLWINLLHSFQLMCINTRSTIAESYVKRIFTFRETVQLFSKAVVPFCIPTISKWHLVLIYTLLSIWCFNVCPSGTLAILICNVLMIWCWSTSFTFICYLHATDDEYSQNSYVKAQIF